MQWFKKWDQFINENLFVNKIKDDVQNIVAKCDFQALNFESVFEMNPDQDLNLIAQSSDFLKKIREKQLRPTDIEKSNETSSLVVDPIQYIMLYNQDQSEAAEPVYIIIQSIKNGKIAPVQLYYITSGVIKFFEYLTNRLIEVAKTSDPSKKYIYKTTNAGENWELQNKDNATSVLKDQMFGDELADLEKNKIISIEIK